MFESSTTLSDELNLSNSDTIDSINNENFSLEDNIFVKDIYSNTEVLGYWKYIVDGISYYIPNYGYILLIDSNFFITFLGFM